MCGIIAIVSFKNHSHNLSKLPEMAGMIRHRGPDDEGYALFDVEYSNYKIYFGKDTPKDVIDSNFKFAPKNRYQYPGERFSVGLAHRRLSIIDLTSAGHQPMCDESGRYWIVFNGEIYNFEEIKKELKKVGYSFFSSCDTEVILKSYMAWGKECQNKFNGMWAIVIWDNQERRLWVSRDRFGVKPLYYMFHDDLFIVCSEIKAILPILKLHPNIKEFYAYLLDGPSESHLETYFKNVCRFPNGCSATYSAKEKKKSLFFENYWELLPLDFDNSPFSTKRLREYAEEYYFLLEDAVRKRLRADVKVGCTLSGGLDSSSITYIANKLRGEAGSAEKIITLSNIYSELNEKYCDESGFIDKVVDFLGVESYRAAPRNKDILAMNDKGIWYGENCNDKLNIASYNTFKICSDIGLKVTLDGQGADEQLGGYGRFWNNYFSTTSKLKFDYWTSMLRNPISLKDAIYFAFFSREYFEGKDIRTMKEYQKKLNKSLDREYRLSRNTFKKDHYFTNVNKAFNWSINNSVKRLLRTMDFNSMAFSVETRQPFMDYRLIKFLNKLPSVYKLHMGWSKYIARIAFSDKLPHEIVWRKDKQGWPMPLKEWVKGDIGTIISREIQRSTFLNEILNRHKIKFDDYSSIPLRLFFRLYNITRVGFIFFDNREDINI